MRDRANGRRAGASLLITALVCTLVHTVGTASPAAAATTINVPADQPTIAAALTVAVDGDTIQVSPGTYAEHIDFEGKDVRLVSASGPIGTTIAPVWVTDGKIRIGPGGAIEGFTISDDGTDAAGTVIATGAGSEIRANRFVPKAGGLDGFAVWLAQSSALVEGNLFSGHTCSDSSGVVGGSAPASGTITNNVFVDNPCTAIDLPTGGNSTLVANNTIVGGRRGVRLPGKAVGSADRIRNNIVVGQEVAAFEYLADNVAPIVENNLVHDNATDYVGFGGDLTGTSGNLRADPVFIDPSTGDLRLGTTSPAVDAASPTDAPAVDFDGTVRPLDGPDADGDAEFDIGAFERDGTEPPPVPQTGILDRGWSGDGTSLFPSRYDIALGPYGNGATYVGSYKQTDGNGPMRITKYTSTGGPAPGWGSAGYVLRAFEPGGKGLSFPTHVVPVGLRITVVGEHYGSTARLGVARLRSDGSYDPAFSSNGRALYRVFPGEHDVVSAFRADVLAGGKIGIAVAAFDVNSGGDLVFTAQAMLRLNSDGTPDRTFSGDGVAVIPNSWSDIRWLSNGASFVGVQGSSSHQVRKLLPSGQLDVRFSGDGIATAACGAHRGANLAVDANGRPVLMCVKVSGTSTVLAMYRFTTAGAFDTSYSGDGKTSWVIPDSSSEFRVHFDQSAKPWVATGGPGTTKRLRLYTLSSSGAPDTSFNGDGAATITLPWNVDLSGVWRSGGRLFVTNYVGDVNVGIVGVKI